MKLARTWVVASLVLAAVAWGQRPYSESGDGARSRGSTRMRDGQIPQPAEMMAVRELAQQMDSTMESVQMKADQRSEKAKMTREEAEGLRRLEVLFARADSFEDNVEHNSENPRATVQAFHRLLGSYLLVDQDFRVLEQSGYLDAEFHNVQSLMDQLAPYYGGYPEYNSRDYQRILRRGESSVALGFSRHDDLQRSDKLRLGVSALGVKSN